MDGWGGGGGGRRGKWWGWGGVKTTLSARTKHVLRQQLVLMAENTELAEQFQLQ